MQSETEWATIGKIVAPFGLRGEMKVVSLSDIPDRFTTLKKIYLGPERIAYAINAVRPHKSEMIVLKLAGVDDATAAERFRNYEIVIPLTELAKLPPDSYYQHDILGLHVATLNGSEIGVITDIMPTAGNDVYIIKASDGREMLIPAVKEIVKQVDLIRQMMYIDPVRGLIDDDAVIDRGDDASGVEDAEEEEDF